MFWAFESLLIETGWWCLGLNKLKRVFFPFFFKISIKLIEFQRNSSVLRHFWLISTSVLGCTTPLLKDTIYSYSREVPRLKYILVGNHSFEQSLKATTIFQVLTRSSKQAVKTQKVKIKWQNFNSQLFIKNMIGKICVA